MYLGKLNIEGSPVTVRYALENVEYGKAPALEKDGNPLKGEPMLVRWNQLFLSPLKFTFTLSATEGDKPIADGIHIRFIVNREKFLSSLA